MIRVVVADDQAMTRWGLRALLESEEGLEAAGEAADGQQAVELARRLRPDVVVMDLRMPAVDGVSATAQIASDPQLGETRVLVLTTYDDDELVFQALRAGASGYLLKDVEPDELVRGIHVVARGDALLAPSVTRRLIQAYAATPARRDPSGSTVGSLTEREREVVTLVGHGLSNDEIAGRLVISPDTARTHVSRARVKVGARDRAQLVVFAYESGLVTAGMSGRTR
jgi:DNA-binding NarL/FixJ family response regulator